MIVYEQSYEQLFYNHLRNLSYISFKFLILIQVVQEQQFKKKAVTDILSKQSTEKLRVYQGDRI